MHRLLLIESSRTLRRGMAKLLARHGFDVLALSDDEASAALIDRELAQDLSTVVMGWQDEPEAACHALLARLSQPDCARIALLLLVAEPVDAERFATRPFTQAVAWPQHAEAPGRARSLLAQIARSTQDAAPAASALKVLLVDDSRTSRTKYQRLLKRHGYEVVTCEHAEAALARAAHESFDLAVIDYHMPGMNGAMLCRALRELPATRELTLTILTGSYEEAVIRDCLAAGAAECMFKTEPDELFVARVQSMAHLRERERRLDGERARLDSILASVGDGVFGVDRAGIVSFVNPAALRLLKYTRADELVGAPAHARIHAADERGRAIAADLSFLQQAYELGDSLSDWETTFWRADAQPLAVECTVRPLHRDGECTGAVVAFRDIAERKRLDDELQWRAHHDHLTQLCNRRHFEDQLEQEIVRLKRSSEHSALLFIDLDRFKQVNDSAGHAAGDALLVSIAQKLKQRTRQSDLVARLGGDEFAVLLRNVDDDHVSGLAEKFRVMLDEMHFAYQGRAFDVSGSVGYVVLDRQTAGHAEALNCADAACQIAKRQGRNQVHRFDAKDDAAVVAAAGRSWMDRLKQALAGDGFVLQFQPMFDLRRGATAVWGHEVLLRLRDGEARLAPHVFLPHAERFELLPAIDTWVLDHLAARLAAQPLPPGVRLHVNVATASLLDAGYRAHLTEWLRTGGFAPGQLCLELKETESLAQLMPALPALSALTQAGLLLMLDDFGRGFGSVGLLQRLPLAAVKFDPKVVRALTDDGPGNSLLRALVGVARATKLVVITPHVEHADDVARLQAAGIDCVQGNALGEPVDAWPAGLTPPATARAPRTPASR